MGKLDGKVALVTGSDSGIGQAIAEEYAKAGADVAVTYRSDREGAEETVRRVEGTGQRALLRQVDVGREEDVALLFEHIGNVFGRLDILVNNAGTGGEQAEVVDIETEYFDRVIRTNLYGPFFCCRAFLRHRRINRETGARSSTSPLSTRRSQVPLTPPTGRQRAAC